MRNGHTPAVDGFTLGPGSRRAVKLVTRLALFYALLAIAAAVGATALTISTVSMSGGGEIVFPVANSEASQIPESLAPPLEVDEGTMSRGYLSEASVSGEGISQLAAIFYFAPRTLTPILHAIVAFGIFALGRRIERNDGFSPQLSRIAYAMGISLMTLAPLTTFIGEYGVSLARFELFGGTDLALWTGGQQVDITPFAAGIGIILVGILLQRGTALQRDTEGLV